MENTEDILNSYINIKNKEESSNKINADKENQYDLENNPLENSPFPENNNIFNKNGINIINDKTPRREKISAISKQNNKSENEQKDLKKQKINDILGGLKQKYNYQLSPYTDIKSFGDLTPGPGEYYHPEIKIGKGQNLRYNNLYKDSEYDITLQYKLLKDNYYQSKIGPGTYNLNLGYEHKSYSQNPKTFVSKLERGPLFKITESVGPGYYNIGNNNKLNNNSIKKSSKEKNKNKFKLKTEQFFQPNNIKVLKSYNFGKSNRAPSGKISFKGQKNFSWKGISDFSGSGIKILKNENKEMTKDDKIIYKNQVFNFDNQKKLGNKRHKFSKLTKQKIQKEISEYNKVNNPLIEYVPKDVVLKGNHLPGPCYYKYTNDSIEGDIKNLNKKYNKDIKKWK